MCFLTPAVSIRQSRPTYRDGEKPIPHLTGTGERPAFGAAPHAPEFQGYDPTLKPGRCAASPSAAVPPGQDWKTRSTLGETESAPAFGVPLHTHSRSDSTLTDTVPSPTAPGPPSADAIAHPPLGA